MDTDREVSVGVERAQPRKVIVSLEGEHDIANKKETESLLTTLFADNELVVVDLSRATFIDSSIINVLYRADQAAREQGCSFRLLMGTEPIVERALQISGVLDQIPCASSREEALK
jgi:stage II sporulation protein AA (anti-sigma F factor antagonist)